MGHTISKQQNQQMSDGQQMMSSSIEQHIDPSTTAKDSQVKIGKTKQIAVKAKKLKKEQTQNRRNGKSTETIKTSIKSGASTSSATNQERNTGSVVITIRLLKMESARNFDGSSNAGNDNHSKLNCPTMDKSQINCEIKSTATTINDVSQQNNRNIHENSKQNQNNSFNVNNNNVSSNQSDANYRLKEYFSTVLTNNLVNCENGNNDNSGLNERRHSIKNEHSNPALRSEVSICDKVQTNCTSQLEQTTSNGMVNSLTQAINAINMTDKLSNDANASETKIKLRSLPDCTNAAVISSNLISKVSPYPHHFPIANIIRSDCLNAIVDEHASHCQQAKADGSCCGKSKGASKESKELKAKIQNWSTRFNSTKLKGIKSLSSSLSSEPSSPSSSTQLTASTNPNSANIELDNSMNKPMNAAISAQKPTTLLLDKSALFSTNGGKVIVVTMDQQQSWFAPDETEDCDKQARLQRAIEIAEGVDSPPGFYSASSLQSLHSLSSSNLPVSGSLNDSNGKLSSNFPHYQVVHCSNSPLRVIPNFLSQLLQHPEEVPRIHSQVDFIHYLVPDLKEITNCSFYWGKMDRYEAERLLENKQEGTFLLRDSAQEDFLFSVSFRKYGRSLHARIEQYNHEFSFDCHDPDVFRSETVTGLLEHYKDPSCVMFFEPALTLPLNRNVVFSLQQLCRATIVSNTTYDGINDLCLPKKLNSYLKEYHYKQCYRTKQFDEPIYSAS